MTQKHIRWVDLAKGIAILLVILGHTSRDEMLIVPFINVGKNLIYAIHLPLFFFLSGYILKRKGNELEPFKTFLVKKVKSLLIPFISYSLLLYILFQIAIHLPYIGHILSSFGSLSLVDYWIENLCKGNPYSFHVWFIYILFIYMMITYFMNRILKNNNYFLIILGLIINLVTEAATFYYPALTAEYLIITTALRYYIFFALGCNRFNKLIEKGNILELFPIFILVYIYAKIDLFASIQVYLAIRILIILCSFSLIIYLCHLASILVDNRIGTILEKVGQRSFSIYLIHQPFFTGFVSLILYKLLPAHPFIIIGCTFMISILCTLTILHMIDHTKYIHAVTKRLLNI